MKGDFSRLSFRPRRRFSSVRLQQGRVQLDADWNEQIDIEAYRDGTGAVDTLGPWGAPFEDAGFGITAQSGDFAIDGGRYYVAGTLCENETGDLLYGAQPDLPGAVVPEQPGFYLAYLDVWQRHVTALEAPEIREVALGGPDTATRTRTVWQVRLLRLGSLDEAALGSADYRDYGAGGELDGPAPARLRARAEPVEEPANECLVPGGAGYRRLENQLYRVEVHQPDGAEGGPSFKWSRDNGAIVSALGDIAGNLIRLADPGRDEVLGFAAARYIELSDDERVLRGEPGVLLRVELVQGDTITVAGWPGDTPLGRDSFGAQATVRRWDGAELAIEVGQPIELEDGVQVEWEDGAFRSGDYWTIPARTFSGDVEWSADAGGPAFEAPHGIAHRFAPLALLRLEAGTWTRVQDARRRFPATTRLTGLYYAGGDGQSAPGGALLPQPLEVGVANGHYRVDGAAVEFRVVAGGGTLTAGAESGPSLTVASAGGLASCSWRIGSGGDQRVEARLVDGTHLPIHFSATPDTGGGREAGIEIKEVILLAVDRPLLNDDTIAADGLDKGIRVVCSEPIDERSVSRPTCWLSIEVPLFVNQELRQTAAYYPIKLAGNVRAAGESIVWEPSSAARVWLREQLPNFVRQTQEPILARLTLKGNYIWAERDQGLYLDGDSFGVRERGDSGTRLRFPSGDGSRGGDFELWFFLTVEQGNRGPVLGVIPRGTTFDERLREAFSLALNREELRRALPADYQIADAPFDIERARRLIVEVLPSQGVTAVRAIAANERGDFATLVAEMLQANLAFDNFRFQIQLQLVNQGELLAAVRAALPRPPRAQPPFSMVIGDDADATTLAQTFPNEFGGTIIAV